MVIALVETATGIENVDAIAAVDGVDVVWLGHYDLTNFLGIPGEFDNPKFHAAVDNLVRGARSMARRRASSPATSNGRAIFAPRGSHDCLRR